MKLFCMAFMLVALWVRFFVEKHCERKEMHYKYICYKYCIIPNKRMLL